MARVAHPATGLPIYTLLPLYRRLYVARVSIGEFAAAWAAGESVSTVKVKREGHVRITGTLSATDMLAVCTLSRLPHKLRIAFMTEPSHPLAWRPMHQILAARLRGQSETLLLGLVRNLLRFRARPFFMTPSGGMTRTLLAADVLAVDADLVGTERGLAAVAGTTDSHADGTIDTLDGHVGWRLPFAGFEGEAVLCEQSAGSILLNGAPVGDHGRHRVRIGALFRHWAGETGQNVRDAKNGYGIW